MEAHGQRGIRSRPKLQPQIGFLGNESLSGIDTNQLGPLLMDRPKIHPLVFVRVCPLRVTPPHDDAFRSSPIVANRQIAQRHQR